MRQAILITAYHDPAQLQRLIDYFDSDFELFIHIDRHSNLKVNRHFFSSNVHIFSRYNTYWGSVNHLRAILLLMRKALLHNELEYFHLITGSDYPIPTLQEFKAFCESHSNENYLEYFPLPRKAWDSEGGLERVRYYWLQQWLLKANGCSPGYWITTWFVKIQRKTGLRRHFTHFGGHLFGGGTYWSVSRQAIEQAMNYLDTNPDYLRRFRFTKIAEEICLPTLWVNSGINLTNDSLRYIDWSDNGHSPRTLTMQDYEAIRASGALFARKLHSKVSDTLIQMLQHHD